MRALTLLLALLSAGTPAAPRAVAAPPGEAAPPLRPGRGPDSRSRAISHYLAARRCHEAADWRCAAAELQQAVDFDGESPELRVSLAEALAASGDGRAAAEEARNAVSLAGDAGPSASRAHVLLGQLARGHDAAAAVRELGRAVALETAAAAGGEAPDPAPWGLLATLQLELGDEGGAQGTLDDLAARAPEEGAAEREVGRWLLEHDQPGRAERHLRRAVALARGDLTAWRLLVQAHRALGRSLEEQDDLRVILELQADDPEALLGLGRAALEAGDLERAGGLLDRYQRTASDRAGAAALASGAWLAAGRAEEALDAARQAEADLRADAEARAAVEAGTPGDQPERADARLLLAEGLALSGLRRFAESARVLALVQEQDGAPWVPARAALAVALSRSGRHGAAAQALEGPLARAPGDLRLLRARAAALEWARRPAAAADALARAAEEQEQRGEEETAGTLRALRAEVLCRAGRAEEAVAALRPAVAARPRVPGLRLALAGALEAAGAGGLAEAELRALLALAPEHPQAQARLAALLAGGVDGAPRPGALDEAEELARSAARRAPRSPEVLSALGRVLSARGDHAGALAALDRAVALSGRSAPALLSLGDAQEAAGQRALAATAWRAALRAAGDEPPGASDRLRALLRRRIREGAAPVAAGRRQGARAGP